MYCYAFIGRVLYVPIRLSHYVYSLGTMIHIAYIIFIVSYLDCTRWQMSNDTAYLTIIYGYTVI